LQFAAILGFCFPFANSWGLDGHTIVCRIAQTRLSNLAAAAVSDLLPTSAGGDLSSECLWADHIKFHYHWSSALHYVDTPDNLCNYHHDSKC
ncbi:hypothetical protein M569_17066, partial [Genlisea aurea]